MARTYLDFDLLIERTGEGYRSRVLDSPIGQATGEFVLPFSPVELENFLLRITRSLGEIRRRARRLETPERQQIRVFGTQLFDAVFKDDVLNALRASLNEANRRDAGLRIRFRLTDVPELANVPWEYLHNTESNRFLSLSIDTPLVRYVDLPTPVRPLAVTPPLRVLVMISSPTDVAPLDVGLEWDRLEAALGDLVERGQVSLHRLNDATLAGLQHPLRLDEYHILHFIGHGGFDELAQDGALLLEDERGQSRLVTGQDLGVMLSGHRSLRLVILNACEGARSSTEDPFAGVATSLLQQGIPAAIAMQFEITDTAAITFAHEFYAALADGYPIDAAVSESRRAIFAQGNEFEWGTPVLYMRAPNGRIFRVGTRSAGKPQVDAEAEAAAVEPSEPQAPAVEPSEPQAEQVVAPAVGERAPQTDQVVAPAVEERAPQTDQTVRPAGEERGGRGMAAASTVVLSLGAVASALLLLGAPAYMSGSSWPALPAFGEPVLALLALVAWYKARGDRALLGAILLGLGATQLLGTIGAAGSRTIGWSAALVIGSALLAVAGSVALAYVRRTPEADGGGTSSAPAAPALALLGAGLLAVGYFLPVGEGQSLFVLNESTAWAHLSWAGAFIGFTVSGVLLMLSGGRSMIGAGLALAFGLDTSLWLIAGVGAAVTEGYRLALEGLGILLGAGLVVTLGGVVAYRHAHRLERGTAPEMMRGSGDP